jgi:uncharacterized repeat protein (TIGR01451 family)
VKLLHIRKTILRLLVCLFSFTLLSVSQSFGAGAGYSTFVVPVDDNDLATVLIDLYSRTDDNTHSVISITAWADTTKVYYDHWENGYGFDPENPGTSTIDETFTLSKGEYRKLESIDITVPRVTGTAPYPYDGRDIIYVVGGSATVTRAGWLEDANTLQAVAWEVYPVRPQLIKYILPFGEELNSSGLRDFERVYAFIQATNDNTKIQIDFNRDGTFDRLDWDRDGTVDADDFKTLDKGDVFLLDRVSIGNQAIDYPPGITDATTGNGTDDNRVIAGTTILATDTIQVQYLIGDEGANYEVRGLSAFPRGFWDDEYYAPVDESTKAGYFTDIYIYNPHADPITINWESSTGANSFSVPAYGTISYVDTAGVSVPESGAVYLKGSDIFWGISTIDAEGQIMDWGYSLVPASLLEKEHYMGWAPAYDDNTAESINLPDPGRPYSSDPRDDRSGLFITAAQDNTIVYIDENNDGTADQTIPLDRLGTAYVVSSDDTTPIDLNDDDLSGARAYATGPIALAYGQNPDFSEGNDNPALDLGYTILPTTDKWFDLVLDIEKKVNPAIVAAGLIEQQTTFTLEVSSAKYTVDGLIVKDILPIGWQYVDDSTTITLPNGTTIPVTSADPAITGTGTGTDPYILTWSGTTKFSTYGTTMAENQIITIEFVAETSVDTFSAATTTPSYVPADVSINNVKAIGTRTVGESPNDVTQTFTASDFEFVTYGDAAVGIVKTTGGTDPLSPGDQFTYTVEVSNPATASSDITGIAIYDPLPEGVTYVDGSSAVSTGTSPTPITDLFDFESGDQGFATSNPPDEEGPDGNPSMNWERGNPTTRSPLGGGNCDDGACYGNGGPEDDHTSGAGVNCWGTDLNDLYSNDINLNQLTCLILPYLWWVQTPKIN